MTGDTKDAALAAPATVSTADTDRYYAMRVDARASNMVDTVYDIAERLLAGEIESCRQTLEKLWALKNGAVADGLAIQLEELITCYQERLTALRGREERIRKLSGESRALLEERLQARSENVGVQQEIAEVSGQREELEARLARLRTRERELGLSEERLKKVLTGNEAEIITTLHDLMMAGSRPAAAPAPAAPAPVMEAVVLGPRVSVPPGPATTIARATPRVVLTPVPAAAPASAAPPPAIPYARSVVKTTNGRVLAEYYYDARVEKGLRHYIYNSRFLLEQLSAGVKKLREDYDRNNHADLLQMVQDANNRVVQSGNLHFEESTSNVVNGQSLQEVWRSLRKQQYGEVERFCSQLRASMELLGSAYYMLLIAQMDELAGKHATDR
jgi:hypothetical protein